MNRINPAEEGLDKFFFLHDKSRNRLFCHLHVVHLGRLASTSKLGNWIANEGMKFIASKYGYSNIYQFGAATYLKKVFHLIHWLDRKKYISPSNFLKIKKMGRISFTLKKNMMESLRSLYSLGILTPLLNVNKPERVWKKIDALIRQCRWGQFSLVLNSVNSSRTTLLHYAVKKGEGEVVNMLLNLGADPNKLNIYQHSPLLDAKCPRIVSQLLRHGAHVNHRGGFTSVTPLHLAVEDGRIDIAKILLENKANPNLLNGSGLSALQTAIYSREKIIIEMVKLLLEYNANTNIHNNYPLLSTLTGKPDIMELFLTKWSRSKCSRT